ncbi:MAG: tetratricopeptide repeat protein [Deltaproteobacteria bacterium]|nr:tetratricopeptide repeat protein [Deltaproteobacteria bacterium]
MKRRTCYMTLVKVFFAIVLISGGVLSAGLAQRAEAAVTLMVKISQLEKALDLIDAMGTSDTGQPPTAMLRGMLQGMEWIDADRSIVLVLDKSGENPLSAILVPFRHTNPNFKQAYNAMSRDNYYILSLPPGNGVYIPENIENEMVGASREPSAHTISLRLALREVVGNNRDSIEGFLENLGQMPQKEPVDPMAPSAEETRQMLTGLLGAVEQVDSLSLSLDLNERQFKMVAETVPVAGSELSAFLESIGMTTRLAGYRPASDITFRSRSYNVDAALDMLNTVFGTIYSKLGINFADLVAVGHNFTGETAGGISYGSGANVMVESMTVLKDEVDSKNFMAKEYLPWIEEYGRSITRIMEKEAGTGLDSMLVRTADSMVKGHKVAGVRIRLPLSPMPFDDGRQTSEGSFMTYDMRTTVVGNLLLTAPDDVRLAEMIQKAGLLRKKTSRGPMMTLEIDMGKYLASLARFIPGHNIDPQSIPDFGKMSFATVAGRYRVISSAAMDTDDIRLMMAYLKGIQPGSGGRGFTPPASESRPASPPPPVVKDAGYWLDQGRLAATYGAYASAIRYYKKAMALGSEKGQVYFNMGIAHGELGNYPEALANLDKAIQVNPDKGTYYYGRGRVHLLSGEKDRAMEDFEHAAELGDPDAQRFLDGAGQ